MSIHLAQCGSCMHLRLLPAPVDSLCKQYKPGSGGHFVGPDLDPHCLTFCGIPERMFETVYLNKISR